jgi:tripartite-type tricarboxylate transporter receptor subunit TctC
MDFKPTRRDVLAGGVASLLAPQAANAAWPDRAITLVHGFAPGGNADVLARLMGNLLPARLGQSVVVEPRPGAGGTTAAGQVARAAPDGYALLWIVAGQATYSSIYKSLSFDPLESFTFIGLAARYPFVLVTYPDSPIRTLQDLIKAARERTEPVTFGTPGIGTAQHLTMEYFRSAADIKLQHIPYKGNTFGTADILARRIDLMIEAPPGLLPLLSDGKLRAIGVAGGTRFFALPDTPTFAEAGLSGFDVTSWSGLGGPAKLPAGIVQRLNAEMRAILNEAAVIDRVHKIGNELAPSTPEEFRDRVAKDIVKWSDVAKRVGLPKI